MHEGVGDTVVLDALAKAEEAIQAELRALKAGESDASAAVTAAVADVSLGDGPGEGAGDGGADAIAKAEGVLCRLRYRRGLLAALTQMVRPTTRSLEGARKMLTFALAQLPAMAASVQWGTTVEQLPCVEGRRAKAVLGSAPRGKIELPSRAEGVKQATALLEQLSAVCRVTAVETFHELCRRRTPRGLRPRSTRAAPHPPVARLLTASRGACAQVALLRLLRPTVGSHPALRHVPPRHLRGVCGRHCCDSPPCGLLLPPSQPVA